jgi:hypothetical protein
MADIVGLRRTRAGGFPWRCNPCEKGSIPRRQWSQYLIPLPKRWRLAFLELDPDQVDAIKHGTACRSRGRQAGHGRAVSMAGELALMELDEEARQWCESILPKTVFHFNTSFSRYAKLPP